MNNSKKKTRRQIKLPRIGNTSNSNSTARDYIKRSRRRHHESSECLAANNKSLQQSIKVPLIAIGHNDSHIEQSMQQRNSSGTTQTRWSQDTIDTRTSPPKYRSLMDLNQQSGFTTNSGKVLFSGPVINRTIPPKTIKKLASFYEPRLYLTKQRQPLYRVNYFATR